MPKVLILVAHRPERSPSQRYRFEQYLPYLSERGYEFTWSPLLSQEDDEKFYRKGNFFGKTLIVLKGQTQRRRDIERFKDFDIIFIQREATFLGNSNFEKAAYKSGKKVIFDFDDAIWMADTSPGNKKWEWIKDPMKFNTNVANAHLVIAGNQFLADKARKIAGERVHVFPTTVDTNVHTPKPHLRGKDKITIGWSGSLSTIKHFKDIVPVLKELDIKFAGKLQFKVLGDEFYENADLRIKGIKWSENTEVDELNSFDIGIMPLPNNEWTKGKCGLKALTYMACGVPVVMSEVGVNIEIAADNSALLASSESEWMNTLTKLIESKSLRDELGMRGRKRVEEKYSVNANKEKYLKLFNDLLIK